MFKDFFAKKMLKLNGVSEEQANLVLGMVKQNPALFQQIAQEIKAKVAGGMGEQEAAMAVMLAHKEELSKLEMK